MKKEKERTRENAIGEKETEGTAGALREEMRGGWRGTKREGESERETEERPPRGEELTNGAKERENGERARRSESKSAFPKRRRRIKRNERNARADEREARERKLRDDA